MKTIKNKQIEALNNRLAEASERLAESNRMRKNF